MTETNGSAPPSPGRRDCASSELWPTRTAPGLRQDRRRAGKRGTPRRIRQIWIDGPMNFRGYWNNPGATSETLSDGWVHTGDIGHMDDEDYVFITDREKDMVIRGGENIGRQEVRRSFTIIPESASAPLRRARRAAGRDSGGSDHAEARRGDRCRRYQGTRGRTPGSLQGAGARVASADLPPRIASGKI